MNAQYKYFAFISYNSHDIAWGKRLQRKLESYRMSATLCSEHGWQRKPINPVFFAPYDIQPGGLSQELQDRLNKAIEYIGNGNLGIPRKTREKFIKILKGEENESN